MPQYDFVSTIEVNGNLNSSNTVILHNIFFYVLYRKNVMQVWNNMSVSKLCLIEIYEWTIPSKIKVTQKRNTPSYVVLNLYDLLSEL